MVRQMINEKDWHEQDSVIEEGSAVQCSAGPGGGTLGGYSDWDLFPLTKPNKSQ